MASAIQAATVPDQQQQQQQLQDRGRASQQQQREQQQKQVTAPTGRRRARSTSDGSQNENTRKESLSGAVARAMFGSLAFFFRLPIRLFRPVKLSSWTVLESFAKREKRALSFSYVWQLLRREKNSFIFHLLGPPILFNTLIGFALFESYSIAEGRLLKRHRPDILEPHPGRDAPWTPLWIVASAGAVAGAAQSLLSSPLDNVRLVLTSQRNAPAKRRRHGHAPPPTPTISWRSVMKAALLPFAASDSQHRRLVKSVQTDHAKTADKLSVQQGKSGSFLTQEQRKVWEQRLKHWSGGVHGAGLLMSVVRDSVGFASFFFIFEVSRRCAHGTSMAVDKTIAWFNTTSTLPSTAPLSGPDTHNDEDRAARFSAKAVDADFSYNSSRTKTGRLVAAFVLIVGGAIGAFAYEVMGRPAELMRVVIWQGRRQWQAERARQQRRARGGRSQRHLRSKDAGSAALEAANNSSSRLESLLTLRAANSGGTRSSRLQSVLSQSHPPHPLKVLAGKAVRPARTPSRQSKVATSSSRKPGPVPAATVPSKPPGAMSLLLAHAKATSTLAYTSSSRQSRTAVPAPVLLLHTYFLAPYLVGAGVTSEGGLVGGAVPGASASPSAASHEGSMRRKVSATTLSAAKLLSKWTNKNPVASTAPPIKLPRIFGGDGSGGPASVAAASGASGSASVDPSAHSDAKMVRASPAPTVAEAASASSSAAAKSSPPKLTYLPPRPQPAPGSVRTASAARQWGSGRAAWALRRLASPYGVGFVIFAWMSGDV